MTKAELYESFDKDMLKEEAEKNEEEEDPTDRKNLKGGENFICSLDCKVCGTQ